MTVRCMRLASIACAVAWAAGRATPAAARTPLPRALPVYRDASKIVIAPVPDALVMDHISPTLLASERQLMKGVMLALPEADRYNVVYVDRRGRVHANQPSLIAIARSYGAQSEDSVAGAASVTPGAPRARATYSCTNPPASTTTGPFRAVYSTCNTPYALSHVYLPCKADGQIFLNYPQNEEPYVYEGGFSATGDPLDAGLAYSWTYDNWSIFMSGDSGFVSVLPRYQCNETVAIEFYPLSTTRVALNVTGFAQNGYGNYAEVYAVDARAGWSPSCAGCIVKRMTAIAQKGFGSSNFATGSYFASDGHFRPTARWGTSYVGFWTGRMPVHYKTYSWSALYTGSYRSYPKTRNVRIHYDDPGDETDEISLQ